MTTARREASREAAMTASPRPGEGRDDMSADATDINSAAASELERSRRQRRYQIWAAFNFERVGFVDGGNSRETLNEATPNLDLRYCNFSHSRSCGKPTFDNCS